MTGPAPGRWPGRLFDDRGQAIQPAQPPHMQPGNFPSWFASSVITKAQAEEEVRLARQGPPESALPARLRRRLGAFR